MAELIEQLPFKSQIVSLNNVSIGGRQFKTSEIVDRLEPHLTKDRIARIGQVIKSRTINVATVVEHIYDIGNISAVMRSAESYGFLPFHIIERQGAKYKVSDRISKGTEKWLNIYKHKETATAFKQLKSEGYQVFATSLNATHTLDEIDFSKKTAIVFGNEKDGISETAKSLADGTFILPMYGFAQSFNISVAAAIAFSSIHRKRYEMGLGGDMSADEIENLKANYYLRTLDSALEILKNSPL